MNQLVDAAWLVADGIAKPVANHTPMMPADCGASVRRGPARRDEPAPLVLHGLARNGSARAGGSVAAGDALRAG
jgi:hypothetical protein